MALIGSPEWFFSQGQTREMKELQEWIEGLRVDFLELFSPEKLSQMNGEELLENVFGNGNKSMCQILTDDNNYRNFGAPGKYKYLFIVYKNNEATSWTIKNGGQRSVDVARSEAKIHAQEVINNLLKCVEIIKDQSPLSTIENYYELDRKLSSVYFYTYPWVLKYFQMVFPQYFPGMYADDTIKRALKIIGLPYHGNQNRLINAGEISLFIRKCKLNNIIFNKVYANKWGWEDKEKVLPCQNAEFNMKDRTESSPVDTRFYKFSKNEKSFISVVTEEKVKKTDFDEFEEAKYIKEISEIEFDDNYCPEIYTPIPEDAPQVIETKSSKTYPRDIEKSKYALARASHKCEFSSDHWTFTRRTDNLPYTEAHHLIPMSQQCLFEYSLDVPANIISLCSTCHNSIHYGTDFERKVVLYELFNQRKNELEGAGIYIDWSALLKMYGIS